MVIRAAHNWANNSELIADVATLYFTPGMRILDPTFGRGNWWKTYLPDNLVTHNWPEDGVDFRDLPHASGSFDVVAYDPPYVCVGGRATSTLVDGYLDRYGLRGAPSTPAELQKLINLGLLECTRVLAPGGILLGKCQDYVSSGKLWIGTHYTLSYALQYCGLELVDRFEHIGNPRPQPAHTRQVHARRNLSTLFVFRKRK